MENILTMLTSRRILYAAAALFLASGVFHVGVWVVDGMPSLSGPISWRKPITFGLSTGILFLSLGWVIGLLRETPWRRRQAIFLSVLLIAEIALIDMQQWRGVASHFNTATRFDAAVFNAMGVLIVTASAIIAAWTRAVFREPLATTREYAVAARAGMLLLNVGNVVGLVMAISGSGALKPIHGIALHAIQALPVAVWILSQFGYPRAWRRVSPMSHWRWLPGSPPR